MHKYLVHVISLHVVESSIPKKSDSQTMNGNSPFSSPLIALMGIVVTWVVAILWIIRPAGSSILSQCTKTDEGAEVVINCNFTAM